MVPSPTGTSQAIESPPLSGPSSPSEVDLAHFDRQAQVFSLDQELPDPALAASLNNSHPAALHLAGLGTSDQSASPPDATRPLETVPEHNNADRRRGGKQHHSDPSQTFDRIRSSVQGLIRHIF